MLVLTACGSIEPELTQCPPTETAAPPTETSPPEDTVADALPPTFESSPELELAPAYLKYDIGEAVLDFVVADLKGNTLPEVAVLEFFSGSTSILINDGHGAFQVTGINNTGECTLGVSAADLNGDSYLDLAI